MATMRLGEDIFESGCDLIDVTSLCRPDTAWHFTDAHGHQHAWYSDGEVAKTYTPSATYDVPSVLKIHDGWEYFEDGERLERFHYECRRCGERITPRYRADATTQYIPGLRWFLINGEAVSSEEFRRRFEERSRLS